jgi:DNA-binding response OmpR family regulator
MEIFRSPEIVLLDVMLPDGDGRELLHDIRALSRIPAAMLTARARNLRSGELCRGVARI